MNLCVISEYTCTFDDFEKMVEENSGDQPYSINTTCKVNDKYDATVDIKKTNDKIVIR